LIKLHNPAITCVEWLVKCKQRAYFLLAYLSISYAQFGRQLPQKVKNLTG